MLQGKTERLIQQALLAAQKGRVMLVVPANKMEAVRERINEMGAWPIGLRIRGVSDET